MFRLALDFRPILLVLGTLMAALGLAMALPMLVDLVTEREEWAVFALCGATVTAVGFALFLSSRGTSRGLSTRQAFVMTVGVWLWLSVLGAMPLYFAGAVPTFTDAFFESISGLTTTGATVIGDLEVLSPGIHLWRGLLQWLGGLGIIVMAVSVLPLLQVGGMQLFKAEAFETPEKILPRATQISGSITLVFVVATLTCMVAYLFAGMNLLDATVHAMTTVATGGFSTRNASLGAFDSAAIDAIATTFMIFGSIPFLLYVQSLQGRWRSLAEDDQVRTFLTLLVVLVGVAMAIQLAAGIHEGTDGGWQSLRFAAVNVTSILTGTGYATADYHAWGPVSTAFFFFIMFIGGCAGSTSCGIKIFRFQVLFQNIRSHVMNVLYPHGIFPRRFNGRPITDQVSAAVMSFFFLYLATFAVSAMALSLTGLDALTALSGAGSAVSNVGPGLGDIIGPAGTYESLNDPAKWILSATMLVGRLEIFSVLVLFSPAFWRM